MRQSGGKWGNAVVLKSSKPRTGSARSSHNHTGSRRKEKMMNAKNNKSIVGMLALSLALPLTLLNGRAGGTPSSKVTFQTPDLVLIPATTGTSDCVTVLSSIIRTSQNKDMSISGSFEAGLLNQTR